MIASVLDMAALNTAARAAIVMPAVFAFADTVIGQPQTSIFAAFGSFAMLVLVDVEGPPLPRLLAYLALAAVGAMFITLGTLCSRNAWLGAGVMAVIGFCVLMSGVINGYIAALSTGALLTFVLPVTIPAPNSAIPDRLEGWALAAGAGICAVMLLWRSRRRADLQHDAARAMRAVADVAVAPECADENLRVARDAVDRLGRRSLVNRSAVPPPHIGDDEGRSRLLVCVRDAVRTGDDGAARAALVLLWTSQHIDNLWRLEADLGERADAARGRVAG